MPRKIPCYVKVNIIDKTETPGLVSSCAGEIHGYLDERSTELHKSGAVKRKLRRCAG
jgi:hypothetical protein